MARRHFLAFSTLAAAITLSAGTTFASMPEAEFKTLIEQYDAKMMEMRKAGSMKLEDAVALQTEFAPRIPVQDLTLAQMRDLHRRSLITTYERGGEHDRTKEALAVLEPMTTGDSVAAVEALAFKAQLLGDSNNEELHDALIETVSKVLTHRRFPEALTEGKAESFWYTVGYSVPKERISELGDELERAATRLPSDAPPSAFAGMTTVYEKASSVDDQTTRRAAEDLRTNTLAALAKAMETGDDRAKAMAKREHSTLEAAPRIAKLVGNPAPELDFTWSSGETIRNLADLKGKVVVLDFWATWCGPCISSFPQVRELTAHYAGYPVEIVGVTSVQGATYFQGGQEKAETPAIEHEQMKRFIKERDITWTVAFTEQEVFNPEYGVRGIPHVVILDPDGKIVHRALHPASSLAKKAALIDPILEQFGFETPPAPKVEEETKGGE
jgi:thiol-disulfide isomerase/thioredoxin